MQEPEHALGGNIDPRPIIIQAPIDKVLEEEMARLVGTSPKALSRKRQRGVIPVGVYAIIDGRVTYSIRRYDQWVESQWPCPQALSSSDSQSASALCGTAAGDVKPSRTRQPRRVSKQQPVLELR